ncbi:uncharacterized protein LOC118184897 isoform X2 [Stegodyphus dumicola]|uniref:uncharacterized protein LOC118184897 isoform X2 n=1 Tax=Stegodyphus dumicola TaxID=202533 RepID=UPI0015AD5334|nr:uncharacterized protein LOC118184897 isoform X2 [Stegodyphus dumicola]
MSSIMTSVFLPYLLSMLLGRTIDLRTYTIGNNVYDDAEFVQESMYFLNTSYQVIQEDVFPYNYFGLPIDIVLRIKANFLTSNSGAMGLDGVLKDTSWKYNSVVVPVTTIYQTVKRQLKKDAIPLSDWKDKIPNSKTHYVDSLLYGGWCVVLFRFHCDIPGDVRAVRHTLTEKLGVIGELGNGTLDRWNKAMAAIQENKDIRGKVKISTNVYSTAPIKEFISSPETLISAIKKFPSDVGKLGQPLFMTLKPLNELDKKYSTVKQSNEMLKDLETLDEMFDDAKVTKVSMMRWVTETMTIFEEEDEERVNNLLESLNQCIKAFYKVCGDISLFKPASKDEIHNAIHLYLSGLPRGIGTYNLAYRRLKEELDAQCENNFHDSIRGLLKVYDEEMMKKGEVKGGLKECQSLCIAEERCRSIGYAEHMTELDLTTSLYHKKEKQCWIYFKSTSTAVVHTPSGVSGDLQIYDRVCY